VLTPDRVSEELSAAKTL